MDAIRTYLDGVFRSLPRTEEVKQAKVELLQMMEDKYNELKADGKTENEAVGMVISEFGNLDEIIESLGLTKEKVKETERTVIEIKEDDIHEYISTVRHQAKQLALGVTFCILSVALLLAILSSSVYPVQIFPEEGAGGIGVIGMLIMIAFGVVLIINSLGPLKRYEPLKEELLYLGDQEKQMVYSIMQENNFGGRVAGSVFLYILSVIPVIFGGIFFGAHESYMLLTVVAMFFLVAVATYPLIIRSAVDEACKVLLQEDDYRETKKRKKRKSKERDRFESIYWSVVVLIFFVGLYTGRGFSWMIFIIAGLFQEVIENIFFHD